MVRTKGSGSALAWLMEPWIAASRSSGRPHRDRLPLRDYGDSDAVEIEIGGFVKVGDPRRPAPFVHVPDFRWECSGRALIEQGALRRDLGGAALFLALDRLSERPLPREVAGHIAVVPENAAFGFRPVYVSGRQRDGSRVWSSAQFITFTG